MRKKINQAKEAEPITREQSENIDLAEKGMDTPLNPRRAKLRASQRDKDTVLKSAKGRKQKG
jgi:hypothetical protein